MTYEAGVTALYKLRNNEKNTVYVQLTILRPPEMQKLDVNPLCPPGSQFAFTTFIYLFTVARSRDGVVSIVTRQRSEKSDDRILLESNVQTGSGAHPVS
jgi:hypothetical protein